MGHNIFKADSHAELEFTQILYIIGEACLVKLIWTTSHTYTHGPPPQVFMHAQKYRKQSKAQINVLKNKQEHKRKASCLPDTKHSAHMLAYV